MAVLTPSPALLRHQGLPFTPREERALTRHLWPDLQDCWGEATESSPEMGTRQPLRSVWGGSLGSKSTQWRRRRAGGTKAKRYQSEQRAVWTACTEGQTSQGFLRKDQDARTSIFTWSLISGFGSLPPAPRQNTKTPAWVLSRPGPQIKRNMLKANTNRILALFWTDSHVFWEKNVNCGVQILDKRKKTGHPVSSWKSREHYLLQKSWWNEEELEWKPVKSLPEITAITSSLSNAEYIEVSFKNSYRRITPCNCTRETVRQHSQFNIILWFKKRFPYILD